MHANKTDTERYFDNQLDLVVGDDTPPLQRALATCKAPFTGTAGMTLGCCSGVGAVGGIFIGFLPLILIVAFIFILIVGVVIACALSGGGDSDCGSDGCDSGCCDTDCFADEYNGCLVIPPAIQCGVRSGKIAKNLCKSGCGLFWAAACCVPCCIGFKNTEFYCIKQQKQSEAKIEELPDEVAKAKAAEASEKAELREVIVHSTNSSQLMSASASSVGRLSKSSSSDLVVPSEIKISEKNIPEATIVKLVAS